MLFNTDYLSQNRENFKSEGFVLFCFLITCPKTCKRHVFFTCAKSMPGGKEPGLQSWGVSENPTAFPSLP